MRAKAISQYHVGVAAEAFVAGMLAHAGWDVLVQYGANQPEYDLQANKDGMSLRVSVKGSQDGGWGVTQSFKKGRTYAQAAQAWCDRHKPGSVLAYVQFEEVELGMAPRVYLATPIEVAEFLAKTKSGHGDTILYEVWTYKKGVGIGHVADIPKSWQFSAERLIELAHSCSEVRPLS